MVRRTKGFTLIEVLLSLTLAGLALSAVASLLRQTILIQFVEQERSDLARRHRAPFDVIHRDAQQLIHVAGLDAVALPDASDTLVQFTALATVTGPDATLIVRHPARVTYSLQTTDGERRLMRRQEDLTTKQERGQAQSQTVARGLESVRLRVHDGTVWQAKWPPEQRQAEPPLALEIRTVWSDGPETEIRRVVPLTFAGM